MVKDILLIPSIKKINVGETVNFSYKIIGDDEEINEVKLTSDSSIVEINGLDVSFIDVGNVLLTLTIEKNSFVKNIIISVEDKSDFSFLLQKLKDELILEGFSLRKNLSLEKDNIIKNIDKKGNSIQLDLIKCLEKHTLEILSIEEKVNFKVDEIIKEQIKYLTEATAKNVSLIKDSSVDELAIVKKIKEDFFLSVNNIFGDFIKNIKEITNKTFDAEVIKKNNLSEEFNIKVENKSKEISKKVDDIIMQMDISYHSINESIDNKTSGVFKELVDTKKNLINDMLIVFKELKEEIKQDYIKLKKQSIVETELYKKQIAEKNEAVINTLDKRIIISTEKNEEMIDEALEKTEKITNKIILDLENKVKGFEVIVDDTLENIKSNVETFFNNGKENFDYNKITILSEIEEAKNEAIKIIIEEQKRVANIINCSVPVGGILLLSITDKPQQIYGSVTSWEKLDHKILFNTTVENGIHAWKRIG